MIDLPLDPTPQSASPALVDFGGLLQPSLGGPVQRIDRMGNRFRIDVTMPPMRSGKVGRQWIARLIRGKSEGVRMRLPLQDFDPGAPGAVKVDGAGQAGRTLAIKGATPNYRFREGQFFSILSGGQHYLTMVDAETAVNALGKATLPVSPMLRVSPANDDVCHVAQPMVEGFILGEAWQWEMQLGDFVSLAYAIDEAG